MARFTIGTDVGGTFTDVWVAEEGGPTRMAKVPTRDDVISAIIEGLRQAASKLDITLEELCESSERLGHGTTVGLNALLTDSTPSTAVITSDGFGDTLEIGRVKRQYAGLNDTEVRDVSNRGRWPPLISREDIWEVTERIDRDGSVVQPLDEDTARSTVEGIADAGAESVAICTLWATQNADHERRLRELVVEGLPDVYVSTSHEVAPVVGEYGRMSTTAANAMLGPVMGQYFSDLDERLSDEGLTSRVLAMTQAGGVVPAESLITRPVSALFSGPVATVIGCRAVGNRIGVDNVLTIDVGGTSFDTGLIVDGSPLMSTETTIAGSDLTFPSIDINSIGAGGGSIATVESGRLTVGPESATADPGPACYGRGGTRPTATDADLVLGVLNPDFFLGGRMTLDVEAARTAIREHVASPLEMSLAEAAWGIRRVLDSNMADLLRRTTVERGYDPRDFTMIACGGSGPSHAWALCRELGIDEFVVPSSATVHSAYGTGTADLRRTEETPIFIRVPPDGAVTDDQLDEFEEALGSVDRAVVDYLSQEVDETAIDVTKILSVRYRGQHNSLDVEYPSNVVSRDNLTTLLESFETQYESLYGGGAGYREAGFELHTVRAVGTGRLATPSPTDTGKPLEQTTSRPLIFDDPDDSQESDVYRTDRPGPGESLEGPAVIEYTGHTAVVPPEGEARTDEFGNLHVEVGG